jgi:hypothetical protein
MVLHSDFDTETGRNGDTSARGSYSEEHDVEEPPGAAPPRPSLSTAIDRGCACGDWPW